ncbi:uncharacterized protein si:ch211-133n4.6 isoform X1 [Pimephales promelas]|uniref:uncharacterized protein si:ch211-133n4.6 isoform X1 n=1 Tax=Pimephales promelas TaxID=90988 RepID=UPI0019556834|nr:uncharacterized protein si:ch211-133n4.6 isoform X1 [Pimephales promelas]KAG1948399.1 hypothetical protein F2P79_012157 [Pimephales promelas]
MLTRNILILCSLVLVLVEADLEAAEGGSQAMFATDHDSTSDEAPTESMNLISPDLPNDELLYYNGATADASSTSAEAGNSAPQVNDVPKADAPKSSMEENDEDEGPDSDEAAVAAAAAVKPAPVPVQQRATKSHNASARKRSKPVSASKKRSRNLRP